VNDERIESLAAAGKIRPLQHHLLVRIVIPMHDSELAPGLAFPPPKDYHPHEIPHYFRQRLIRFLEARHPVLPRFLDPILPQREAVQARAAWRKLRSEGVEPGDALLALGIVAKFPTVIVPGEAYARILRAGCTCDATKEEEILIDSSIGEPLTDSLRIIRCSEVLGGIPAASERAAARIRAFERDHIGFASLRVHVG